MPDENENIKKCWVVRWLKRHQGCREFSAVSATEKELKESPEVEVVLQASDWRTARREAESRQRHFENMCGRQF